MSVNWKAYQDFTNTTAIFPEEKALEYLGLGLASEGGEVAGVIKKAIRDNTYSLEVRDKIKAELGDLCWYIAQICQHLNLDFEEVLETNVKKLSSRKERNQLTGDGDDR